MILGKRKEGVGLVLKIVTYHQGGQGVQKVTKNHQVVNGRPHEERGENSIRLK